MLFLIETFLNEKVKFGCCEVNNLLRPEIKIWDR